MRHSSNAVGGAVRFDIPSSHTHGGWWLVFGGWLLVAACIVLEPQYCDAVSCGVDLCDVTFCDGDAVR